MIGDEEELDKYLIKIVEETSDGGIFDDMEIEYLKKMILMKKMKNQLKRKK